MDTIHDSTIMALAATYPTVQVINKKINREIGPTYCTLTSQEISSDVVIISFEMSAQMRDKYSCVEITLSSLRRRLTHRWAIAELGPGAPTEQQASMSPEICSIVDGHE